MQARLMRQLLDDLGSTTQTCKPGLNRISHSTMQSTIEGYMAPLRVSCCLHIMSSNIKFINIDEVKAGYSDYPFATESSLQ